MTAVAEAVSLRFALEPYSEKLVQEMRPLWDEHAKEVGSDPAQVNPNLTLYTNSQKTGMLRIYTARVGYMLMGYQIFFVMPHPHRRDRLEACQDILYLDPEVRKGLVGLKFLKWCDEQLRREKVQMILHQIRASNNFGRLFERMGYRLFDVTYAKEF